MTPWVITFESTHAAMAATQAFKDGSVRCAVIPTPVAISAGCGMALRFTCEDPSAVLKTLAPAAFPANQATLYQELSRHEYVRVDLPSAP